MVTVGNGDVARGHDAVGIRRVHGNAVDISLGGGGVDAGGVVQRRCNVVRVHSDGRVGDVGGEVHDTAAGVDDFTLRHRGAVHIELVEYRLFSVVDSLGVVNGDVVEIEGVRSDHGAAVQDRVVFRSGKDEREEELTLFAASILGELHGILQRDLFILAEIHLHIVPAGFVDAFIDLVREGGRHGDQALGVVGAVAVAVGHIVALDPQLDAVIGDVEPEAEGTRVFKLDRLAVNAQSDPAVLTGVGQVGGQTVELQTHGMLAVMHLAVGLVGQRKRHVVVPGRSLTVVDHVPHVNISLSALKVEEHIRASAEIELEADGRMAAHIQRCGHVAGHVRRSARLIDGRELQPVEAAERSVVRGERHVVRTEADLVQTVVDRGLDGNVRRLAEGDGDNGLIQRDRVRRGDGDLLLTDDLAVVLHLRGHGALGAVGREDAVFNGAHAAFLERPLGIGGNVDLGADRVGAERIELHGAAGGVVIIVAADGGVGKHTVSGGVGDDEDGVGGRTLAAVGQGAVDLQILAGTLRAEGGGSAAVAVAGVDAAHADHVIRHLIHGEAGGVRGLLAVGHGHDKGAVRSDADEGSRRDVGAMVLGPLVDRISVCVGLDKPCPRGDRVLFPAGHRIGDAAHLDLGDAVGSGLTGDRVLVIVDDKSGIRGAHVAETALAVLIVIAVAHVPAKGLTDILGMLLVVIRGVPAQHRVRRRDDIAVAQLLRGQSLRRSDLGAEIAERRVHALVARDDVVVVMLQINVHGVDDLSSRALIVVDDDFLFLDAGRKLPAFLGDQLVVVVCRRVFIVMKNCKRAEREHAHEHDDYEQHCQALGQSILAHSFFSFLYIFGLMRSM